MQKYLPTFGLKRKSSSSGDSTTDEDDAAYPSSVVLAQPDLEKLDPKMLKKIRRQIKSDRKADFLEALNEHRAFLTRIPLPSVCSVDTAQAFKDAVREHVVLNGVKFVGDHRMEAFVAAVKRIVERHFDNREDCLQHSDRIVRSISRTYSGADSYFVLQKVFGGPSFLLKPREDNPPPVDVKLGIDIKDNQLKCRICTVNYFGLYRHEDINSLFSCKRKSKLESWIDIDAVVVDKIVFSPSITSNRYLCIRTPEPPPIISKEVSELF